MSAEVTMTERLMADPPKSVALVVNPSSSRSKGRHVGRKTAQLLQRAGVSVTAAWGTDEDATRDALKLALAAKPDAVVAVGGDGLVHIALQAVSGTDVPLGIVPAGTGNDIATSLGISSGDVPGAVSTILSGSWISVDAARVGDRWFAGVMACGFDALANERANQMRRGPGTLRYVAAMLAEMKVFRPMPFELTLDASTIAAPMMLVAVGNGPCYGGGMRVCPHADLDDGMLDVTVVNEISKVEFLKVFPSVYAGTHLHHPAVDYHRARKVEVSAPGGLAYADGERIGPLPVSAEAVPGALRVYAPGPA